MGGGHRRTSAGRGVRLQLLRLLRGGFCRGRGCEACRGDCGAAYEEASEQATLTSMSHGLRFLSRRTSKPKTSKHVARLWQVWLHLETTECSTEMSVLRQMSLMRACSAATSTPLSARWRHVALSDHFEPSSSASAAVFLSKLGLFLLTE